MGILSQYGGVSVSPFVLVIIEFSGLLACIKLHVRPGHRAYEFILVMSDC